MECYLNHCFAKFFSKPEAPVVVPLEESSSSKLKNLAETIFNVLSITPYVGLVASPVRFTVGLGQFSTGAFLGSTGVLLGAFYDNEKFQARRKAGAENMLHGYLNMWRGGIDSIAAYASYSLLDEFSGNESQNSVTGQSVLLAMAVPLARLTYELFAREKPFSPYVKNDSNTTLEEQLAQTEKLFRTCSLIPVGGALAGVARSIMGFGQGVSGVFNQNIGVLGKVASTKTIFNKYIANGQRHALHGSVNMTGGFIEIFSSLSCVGPLGFLLCRNDVSAPFFEYS